MANIPLNELITFYEKIVTFSQPEELFGDLGSTPGEQMHQLDLSFKSFIKLYHPDRYVRQPAELFYVTEIVKNVNSLRQQAVEKIKIQAYGDTDACDYKGVIQTPQCDYFVKDLLVEGSLADIYRGYYLDAADSAQPRKEVVIKIIADRANNGLVDQEAAFYRTLTHRCFPGFIESFRTPQGNHAIVLSYIADGYDLIELVRRYRQQYHVPGIPQEHLVWILDRFLSALGLLHENGILHGNIQPDNLIIQPRNHNGLLIDFLHCRIDPQPEDIFRVVNPLYCAPEVLTRRFKPHPVSDIYALGWCMIEMLGGTGGRLDDAIALHPSLRTFLQKMTLPDPAKRAADAWALAGELKKLRQQLYGKKPNFIPLNIGDPHGRR
jgi:serine/threonine protein kinase